MSNFFIDALSDPIIGGGVVSITTYTVTYVDGIATKVPSTKRFTARKSIQPLSPDEANSLGFGDYGTNEFYTLYTTTKVAMPSGAGTALVFRFNNKDYYVRKVLPFVWDEDTPMQQGYYEVILSKYSDKVNPN